MADDRMDVEQTTGYFHAGPEQSLYLLVLTDPELSYDDHTEDFSIGLFETKQQTEETAQYYLRNVKGFRDVPCTYRVAEKKIRGRSSGEPPNLVWMIQGWNVNQDFDETDVIESDCFLSRKQADSELKRMKKQHRRQHWVLGRWRPGERNWQDGFERV